MHLRRATAIALPYLILAIGVAVVLSPSPAGAQTSGTWTVDASGNWSTSGNWVGGIVPNGTDGTANFTFDITAPRTVTLDTTRTIGNLVFSDGGAAGSAWILTGAPTLTLATAIGTPLITTTTDATISLTLGGTQGFTKDGAATLILSGNNSITGTTTISAGTLQLGNGGATGSLSGNIVNNGVLAFNRSNLYTYSGNISGTGSISVTAPSGTNYLQLSGSNTFTGATNLLVGELRLGSNNALLNSTVNLSAGTTLSFATGVTAPVIGGLAGPAAVSLYTQSLQAANLTVGSNNESTVYSGNLSGGGTLTKIGTGTLTLSGNNLNNGTTTITAGTLQLGNGGSTGTVFGAIVNNGTLALNFGASPTVSVLSAVSGTGGVTKFGSGTTTLNTGTYTGATTIYAGILQTTLPTASNLALAGGMFAPTTSTFTRGLGSGANQVRWTDSGGFATISNISPLTINIGGANQALTWGATDFVPAGRSLLFSYNGTMKFDNPLDFAGGTRTIDVDRGPNDVYSTNNTEISRVVSNGALVKSGNGFLVLSATNTYTGGTTISGGKLQAAEGVGLPTTGNLTLAGGIFETGGAFTRALGTLSGQVQFTGSGGFSSTGAQSLTVNLGGAGAAVVWGTGGFVPDGSALMFDSSGSAKTETFVNPIDLRGGVRNITNYSGTAELAGAISNGGLVVDGGRYFSNATVYLSATNSFAGGLTISAGTVHADDGVGLPAASNLSLAGVLYTKGTFTRALGTGAGQVQWTGDGGFGSLGGNLTLNFGGAGQQVTWGSGGFVPAGNILILRDVDKVTSTKLINGIDLGGSTRTIRTDALGGISELAGVITNGGVTFDGSGTTILSATNTYGGQTTVTNGSLRAVDGVGLPVNSNLSLGAGGFLESHGAFTRALGTGSGQVQMTSISGGFSAVGGNLIVNIGGAGAQLTRGVNGFYTANGSLGLSNTFANSSDSKITFVNAIDIGNFFPLGIDYVDNPNSTTDSAEISGVLSNGAVTKSGSGTVLLSAVNTFAGNLTINNGGIALGNNAAVSNATIDVSFSGRLSFGTGTTAPVIGGLTGSTDIALTDGVGAAVTLSIGANNATTAYSGKFSGAGSLFKVGTGTLTLSGASTFTGTTTVSNGTLTVANNSLLTSSAVTVAGGALNFTTAATAPVFGSLAGSGNISLLSGSTPIALSVGGDGTSTTYSGVMTGTSGSLTKNGAGTLILTANQSYSGTTTISTGTLQLGNGGTAGTVGGLIVNNATLAINRSNSFSLSFAISGPGSITKPAGAGTVTLATANTFSGATTVSAGKINLGNSLSLQNSTATAMIDNAFTFGSLSAATFGGLAGTGNLNAISTLTSAVNLTVGGNNQSTTYSGVLTGDGTFTKVGTGTLILANDNLMTGTTTISAGTLQLGAGGTTGSVAGAIVNNATLVFNYAPIQSFSTPGGVTSSAAISGTGGVVSNGPGRTILSGSVTYSGPTTINAGILSGNLSANSNLVLNGGVYESIANSETFSRALGTGAGQVQWTGSGGFGTSGILTVNIGGAAQSLTWGTTSFVPNGSDLLLEYSYSLQTIPPTIPNAKFVNPINLGGTERTVQAIDGTGLGYPGSAELSGAISNGALRKSGNGLLILSATNTYAGGTTIVDGKLQATQGTSLPSTGVLTLAGGMLETTGTFSRSIGTGSGQVNWTASGGFSSNGTLNVNIGGAAAQLVWGSAGFVPAGSALMFGGSATSGMLTFFNPIDLNGGVREIQTSGGGTSQLTAAVTNGGLLVTGYGTLYLSGTNTFAGGLTINQATVRAVDGVGLPSQSNLTLTNLGVYAQSGTFTRPLGTGAGQIQWTGGGGFGAVGGNLNVNLGGSAQQVTWGSGGFVPVGSPLYFESPDIALQTKFMNPINLAGAVREMKAYLDTYAELSGTLSSGGISSTGDGVVYLSGTNTYAGATTVTEGVLRAVDGVGLPSGSNLTLGSGGVFVSSGTFTRAIGTAAGQVQWSGNGGGFGAYGGDLLVNFGGAGAQLVWGQNGFLSSTIDLEFGDAFFLDFVDSKVTIANPIDLNNGNRSVYVEDNPDSPNDFAELSGTISNGALTKRGDGTLILSGANTFGNGLIVSDGVVRLGTATTLQNIAVTLQTSDGLDFAAGVTSPVIGSLSATFSSAGFALVDAAGAPVQLTIGNVPSLTTYAGGMRGTGSVNKIGIGTLTLTGTNTYTGGTTITGGTLQVGNNGINGSLAGDIVNNATLQFNRTNAYTFAGAISGTGVLKKGSAGTLTLTGDNSYSGGTVVGTATPIGGGIIVVGHAHALGTGQVDLLDGGVTIGAGIDAVTGSINVGVDPNSSSGSGSQPTSLTIPAGSSLTTAGTLKINQVDASMTIGGNVTVHSFESIGTPYTFTGGTFKIDGGNYIHGSGTGSSFNFMSIDGAGTPSLVLYGTTNSGVEAAVIGSSAGGKLTVDNGSKLSMLGTDVRVGLVGGSFQVMRGDAYIGLSTTGNGEVTITQSGSEWNLASDLHVGYSGTGKLTVSSGALVTGATGTLGSASTGNGTVNVTDLGSQWNLTGQLAVGYGSVGVLNLTAGGMASSQTGILGVVAGGNGTVKVAGLGSQWTMTDTLAVGIASTGALNIESGGRVSNSVGTIGANALSNGSVTISGSGSQWINSGILYVGRLGTGSLDISSGGSVLDVDGYLGRDGGGVGTATVSGAGSVWQSSGYLFLGGNNTAIGGTGSLTVSNGGSVMAGVLVRVWGGSTLTLLGGGSVAANSLQMNNGTLTYSGGTLQAPVVLNAGTSTINVTIGASLALNNVTGTGGFTKSGVGTLVVSASTNSFAGGATVSAGRLLLADGSMLIGTGPILVGAGGKLAGESTIKGSVTLNAETTGGAGDGGTLSPGTDGASGEGVGKLTVQSNVAFAAGSTFTFQFLGGLHASDNPTLQATYAGTEWDLLTATGTLTLGSGVVHLNVESMATDGALGANGSGRSSTPFDEEAPFNDSMRWLFAHADGGLLYSGDINDHFAIDASQVNETYGAPNTPNYIRTYWISTSGNDLYLNYSAVPEPSSLVLTAVAVAGLAWRRRRKHHSLGGGGSNTAFGSTEPLCECGL